MPGKRARRLALDMADAHLERAGVTKGAGGLQREELAAQFLPAAVAAADLVDVAKQMLKRSLRQLEENGEKLAQLAGLASVPGVTGISQGLVDLDLERFGVQLAERKARENEDPRFYPGHSADQAVNNDGN